MNYYSIPPLLTAIIFIVLGLVVLFKNKQKVGLSFFILSIAVFWWQFTWFILFNTHDKNLAWLLIRIGYTGLIFLPIWFFNFVLTFGEQKKKVLIHYLIGLIFIISIWTTKYFVSGYYEYFFGFYPKANWMHVVYLVWTTYLLSIPHFYIYKNVFIKTKEPYLRNRIKIFIVASSIYVVAAVDYLVNYGCNFYPFGFVFVLVGLSLYVYAIVKYNLMDIDLAWRYVLKYIIYIILNILVCVGLLLIFHQNISYFFMGILLFSGIFIFFTKDLLLNKIDNILLKKQNEVWAKLDALAKNPTKFYKLEEIADIVVKQVAEALNLTHSAYYSLDEEANEYKLLVNNNGSDTLVKLYMDNPIVHYLKTKRQVIYRQNLLNLKQNPELLTYLEQIKYEMCFPIFFNNTELIGIICYGIKTNNGIYHKQDVDYLTNIVTKIQDDIINVKMVEDLSQQYAEEFTRAFKDKYTNDLLEAVEILERAKTTEEFCSDLNTIIYRAIKSKGIVIYLYDEQTEEYKYQPFVKKDIVEKDRRRLDEENNSKNYDIQPRNTILQEKDSIINYLKKKRGVIKARNIYEAVNKADTTELEDIANFFIDIGGELLVPLMQTNLLGFVVIRESTRAQKYTDEEIKLLMFLIDKAKTTLDNLILRVKALKDDLMGLFNKAYLHKCLQEEIQYAIEKNMHLSYLMIDVDHFKKYNDDFGHEAGDDLLRVMGNYLRKSVRPSDEVFRYGGEEIGIILPKTNPEEANKLAERIREGISTDEELIKLKKEVGREITISIGTATIREVLNRESITNKEAKNLKNQMIEIADTYLYQAKEGGRNKVMSCKALNRLEMLQFVGRNKNNLESKEIKL